MRRRRLATRYENEALCFGAIAPPPLPTASHAAAEETAGCLGIKFIYL